MKKPGFRRRAASAAATLASFGMLVSSVAATCPDGDVLRSLALSHPDVEAFIRLEPLDVLPECVMTPCPDGAEAVSAFSASFGEQSHRLFIGGAAYGGRVTGEGEDLLVLPYEFIFAMFPDWSGSVEAVVGKEYIKVNGRCFYCGYVAEDGVPLDALCLALGAERTDSDGEVFVSRAASPPLTAGEFYDPDDLFWLSRIISSESMIEPFDGKVAVGNVVLNRVRSPDFPGSVRDVVFDDRYGIVQFSPVSAGVIYRDPDCESVDAAKVCLEGFSLSGEILYFMNPSLAESTWISDTRQEVMTIGRHTFYS